jgi:Kdo2-lipid IVA lauroyltransferase/acyltransferase
MLRNHVTWTRQDWARRCFIWPLEALGLLLVLSLLATLPRRAAASLGGALSGCVGPKLSKQHARAMGRNLSIAFPSMPAEERKVLERRIWRHFGQVLSSYSHLPPLLRRGDANHMIEVEGAEHLAEAARSGGFLMVGAHFGHWELTGCYAAIKGYPMSALYTPESNPWIDRIIGLLRNKASRESELIARGPAAVRGMMESLKRGRGLFILVDQRVDDGEWLSFFGQPAQTTTTPARLARRFNCPILLGRAILLSGGRYRITFYEPIRPRPDEDTDADILRMTRSINAAFESWIAEHPEQWLCMKRRWPKPREAGNPLAKSTAQNEHRPAPASID